MNRRELEDAIRDEVRQWPGVTVEFVEGGKHPKAQFCFEGKQAARAYPGTPSDSSFGLHKCLGDMRRFVRQLGAVRSKPEPSKDEDERRYTRNDAGVDQRPDPVAREKVKGKPSMSDQLAPAATPELTAERIAAWAAEIIDGIYFGLPAEVYHQVERLSGSGIQRMCVSPATFWRGSWLDPDRPEPDEDSTKAQVLGRAYHCARLEPECFDGRYCAKPEKSSVADCLTSDAAIKAELKERGLVQSIGNETIVERAQRLVESGYDKPIWALIEADFEATRNGRIAIPRTIFDEIVRDMERIHRNDDIAPLLGAGQAEVSIFWTDRYGIKMKARLDYLKPDSWSDFKTFDNKRGLVLAQALSNAVRYNRLHVQAVVYREAVEAIRTGDLDVIGGSDILQYELIKQIANEQTNELACWFIFQEKNGVPNLLARQFPFFAVPLNNETWSAGATDEQIVTAEAAQITRTGLFIRAMQDIDHAKREFLMYSQIYRRGEPWAPPEPIGAFGDQDFSPRWLEGIWE